MPFSDNSCPCLIFFGGNESGIIFFFFFYIYSMLGICLENFIHAQNYMNDQRVITTLLFLTLYANQSKVGLCVGNRCENANREAFSFQQAKQTLNCSRFTYSKIQPYH